MQNLVLADEQQFKKNYAESPDYVEDWNYPSIHTPLYK